MNLPSRRIEAKAQGCSRYFTGLPCLRAGHVSERLTSSGNCISCSIEKKRDYRQASKAKVNAANRRYRAEHRVQESIANKRRRDADPLRFKANGDRYRRKHPEKHAARQARRRADLLLRTPAWADVEKIAAIYAEAARLTRETGIQHDVDHVIPLKGKLVSGLHVEGNLQILRFSENRSKNNQFVPILQVHRR